MMKDILFRPARRSFLKSAGSVAALGVLPTTIVRATDNPFSDLRLYADFEQATWEQALEAQDPQLVSWRVYANEVGASLSTQHARNGAKSFRSYMVNRAYNTTYLDAWRAELRGNRPASDGVTRELEMWQTHWYGFSVYIPAPWQTSSVWELFHQMHGEPPHDYFNYWNRNPWFAIYVGHAGSGYADKYSIQVRYCSVHMSKSSKDDVKTGYLNRSISMLPDVGKWTDWVVQVRPDYRPNNEGGIGFTRVWKDGQLIVDYRGPNYDYQDRGPNLNFGLYKRSWSGSGATNDSVRERTYFYDEIRVSRANVGSYDLVAPRGSMASVPPNPPDVVVE